MYSTTVLPVSLMNEATYYRLGSHSL